MSAATMNFPKLSIQLTEIKKTSISLAMTLVMFGVLCATPACSVAQFVSEFNQYASEILPAAQSVLSILALFGVGAPAAALPAIKSDVAKVESLMTDFGSASTQAAPGIRNQLLAAMQVLTQDVNTIFSLAQVSDANTQAKLTALITLVDSLIEEMVILIPTANTNAAFNLSGAHARITLQSKGDFVTLFNGKLVEPTGITAVDGLTKKLKLHNHSVFVRWATLGVAN